MPAARRAHAAAAGGAPERLGRARCVRLQSCCALCQPPAVAVLGRVRRVHVHSPPCQPHQRLRPGLRFLLRLFLAGEAVLQDHWHQEEEVLRRDLENSNGVYARFVRRCLVDGDRLFS